MHVRTTFQAARNIEVYDRVRKRTFRCTKKRVPSLLIFETLPCYYFMEALKAIHMSITLYLFHNTLLQPSIITIGLWLIRGNSNMFF